MANQDSSSSSSSKSPANKPATGTQTNKLTLQTVLDDVAPFLEENLSQQKTVHSKISVMELSKSTVSVLLSQYKVQSQEILRTTALAM
jgi:hypothetical protein